MEASRIMRILRIRNFEKYQDRMKTKNAPWIKLYTKLLCDIDFLKLDVEARYLYVGLLILAAETGNSTVNDPAYLCHRLAIERTRFNLTPLFRSGLLLASERTIRRERERENRERDREGEREGEGSVRGEAVQVAKQPSRQLTDDEWLQTKVRSNPAYTNLNIDQELGKMDAWLSTRPQKQKTRRFIINWLNRAEKPVNGLQADPMKAMVQAFVQRGSHD
jgi:hypothetical protein